MTQKKGTIKDIERLINKRNSPKGEQDNREFELAKEHMKKFDPRRWETSMTLKQQMNVFTPGNYQPNDSILKNFLKP